MQYVNLGRSGMKVSRLCLGTMTFGSKKWRNWMLEEEEARPIFRRAIEVGINFFDTADVYSLGVSEEITGRALRELCKGRDEYVVATKVHQRMGDHPNQQGLSRKHIFEGIEASLRRLGLEYVDLYQIHRWDPQTPIEETMEALHDVVRTGKVRYIGASSMYAWQFAKAVFSADLHGWSRFASMQNHYNIIYREEEREMIPFCMDQGIAVIPWSPLARGFVMGNRTREKGGDTIRSKEDSFAHAMYYQDADFDIADRIGLLAGRLGIARATLALAWMLHKPGVTSPIVGTTRLQHLEDAVAALEVKLSRGDIAYLEEPYRPKGVLGFS
ncbi:MAG TPA: aldo/keto reductase [Candidatus Acidoferrum sp.]|nr:aldo/keto reductase [Candidatus Acidoferrum sp.]